MTVGIIYADGCLMVPGIISRNNPCMRAIKSFEHIIRDPRLQHVVWVQKWGSYRNNEVMGIKEKSGKFLSLSEGGWETAVHLQKNLLSKYALSVHVILDVPWDESRDENSYDPLFHISRLSPKEWQGKEMPLPKDDTWLKGNHEIMDKLSKIATIVDPVELHCPRGKCNLLHYRDDDHLRASYVRNHAVWVDSIFENVSGQ